MSARSPRRAWAPRAALFALALSAYAYFYQAGGWNQNVRFDLVRAVAEAGTARIDRYRGNTGDLARRDGRYYCDKAPGASWLGVPVYAALRPLGGDAPGPRFLDRAAWAVTAFAVGLPAALAVAALFSLLLALGLSERSAAAVALAYAFGTLAFPYATLFYGHQLAASLSLLAFSLLVCARGGRRVGAAPPAVLAGAGLLAGYAVAAEYPAGLAAAALAGYAAVWVRPWPRLLWFAAGLALPGLAVAAYHAVVFGGPLTLPYEFSTQGNRSQGFFMGIGTPRPDALWGITFSRFRGLFFSSPWLLLALPGAALLWRRGHRAETAVCGAIALFFLWLNASLVDWQGGWALGPRYLVPALPFLAVLAAGCAAARPARVGGHRIAWRLGWTAGIAAAVYAAFLMLAGTAVKPEVDLQVERPFGQYVLPRFYEGQLGVNTQGIDEIAPGGEPRSFNAGMLLGLEGRASLLPLGGATLLLGTWLALAVRRREPRDQSPAP